MNAKNVFNFMLLIPCTLAMQGLRSAAAAPLVLVEEGVSRAPIVIDVDAPPRTREAADELALYIEKVTGAKPTVLEGEPEPLPESAIWVGYQPALEALFPEVDLNFAPPEEIVIAATDRHLLIAGHDRWNPEHMTVEGRRGGGIEGVQQAYGTVNAVYTFIQDYLDVRWLWPGELGEDVIPRDTLAFAPFEYRYQPQMWLRSGLFALSVPERPGQAHAWVRLQRLQLDASGAAHSLGSTVGGHAFGNWWNRFHETHPEYFALQPDGTRSGFPSPGNVKLCQSNPAVWGQWLADVEAALVVDPTRFIFNASPNDGHNSGICVCENCLAWDHPDHQWSDHHPTGAPFRYQWRGVAQEYVLMSDRYVTFANHLARALKERYPDQRYYVTLHAYGPSLPAPLEAVPDDNLLITGVYSFLLDFDVWTRTLFADWAAIGASLIWRPNIPHSGWKWTPYPVASLTDVMNGFAYVAEHNVVGIFVDTVWEMSWATRGPLYYLMAQLTWNPQADGEAIMADYYQRAFGKGAPEMEAYWQLIEQKTTEMFTGARRAPPEWFRQVFDDAFFDKAFAILDRAETAVDAEPGKFRDRIVFSRNGLRFAQTVIDQELLLKRLREDRDVDPRSTETAQANFEFLRRLASENPHLFFEQRVHNLYRWPR